MVESSIIDGIKDETHEIEKRIKGLIKPTHNEPLNLFSQALLRITLLQKTDEF